MNTDVIAADSMHVARSFSSANHRRSVRPERSRSTPAPASRRRPCATPRQALVPGVGQQAGHRGRRAGQVVGAAGAVDHQRRNRDRLQQSPASSRPRSCSRRRASARPRPSSATPASSPSRRRTPGGTPMLSWNRRDGVGPSSCRDQRRELFRQIGAWLVVVCERRFHERQPPDGRPASGGMHREQRARRVAVDARRAAGLRDERLEIIDFAIRRVRRGISAVAAAPAIVGIDSELARQQRRQPAERAEVAIVGGRFDEDERRAFTGAVERDAGAVGGSNGSGRGDRCQRAWNPCIGLCSKRGSMHYQDR